MCCFPCHFPALVLLFWGLFLWFSQVEFFPTLSLISPDEFIFFAHVSSPSLYSRLVLSSSFHRICLTFIHLLPFAHVIFHAYPLAPFLPILLSFLFPFLLLSRSHTHIHTHTYSHSDAYVPTSPWLNEIRTRVSTGDARDASSVCVTRIRTYTRVQRTRHGRIYTRVNAATWTRDGQTPEISDPDVVVSKSPRKPLRL